MAYKLITDPGHGWLQVPVTEFTKAVRDGVGFTSYSYVNPQTGYVYLEEDYDANQFITWRKDQTGEALVYDIVNSDEDSFVRRLPNIREFNGGMA